MSLVDIDWLSKLNTTAIEVEESKVLLRNDEGSNKTAIGLVNKYLPVSTARCHKFFEKDIVYETGVPCVGRNLKHHVQN
jgi:hypothetical protein